MIMFEMCIHSVIICDVLLKWVGKFSIKKAIDFIRVIIVGIDFLKIGSWRKSNRLVHTYQNGTLAFSNDFLSLQKENKSIAIFLFKKHFANIKISQSYRNFV